MTDHAEIAHGRPYWMRSIAVLKECLRQPSQVASVIPSSRFLTEAIADRACVRKASRIVDLGPGTGGTTDRLLQNARPDCQVLAIEKTAGFIGPLKALNDPRLIVVEEDVVGLQRILNANDFGSPDVIVSGIPFSSLDPAAAKATMHSIFHALAPGGTFIAYQLRKNVQRYACPHFGSASVQIVLLNVPPLRVFVWQKTDL